MSDVYRSIGAKIYDVNEDQITDEMLRKVEAAAHSAARSLELRDQLAALKRQISAQEKRVFNAQTREARASARHYLRALCVEAARLEHGITALDNLRE